MIHTGGCHRVLGANRDDTWFSLIGALPAGGTRLNYYRGAYDQMLVYGEALSQEALWETRYWRSFVPTPSLLADYSFDEGAGSVIHNYAGPKNGTAYGHPVWTYGQADPTLSVDVFPGYVYEPVGDRYNLGRYNYPTETDPSTESHIFPVNTNLLEVWWASRSANLDMPPVYYPSYVRRYRCDWPTNAPEIVIASGLGATPTLANVSVYAQNDTNLPGYNPNEEHALTMNGKVYACAMI